METSHLLPPIWNVPYLQNSFFTGREDILHQLRQTLHAENAVALSHPQGISGLGGIGKTQTILEYAYRYATDYEAVLWIQADSTTALVSGYVTLARLLNLPERYERDQNRIIEAVLRWLRVHTNWLLVFDNMDDLSVAEPFLPKAGPGHIVFTTRAHALGKIAQCLEVQQMELETGALLLLRRAGILPLQTPLDRAVSDDHDAASAISQELAGLPLALDQAGAYIRETSCSLRDYLTRYRTRHQDLLQARGSFNQDYPASVATTWSLSFEKIRQTHPEASELLTFCAFLAPDAIPEEILTSGASHLGTVLAPVATDPIRLDQACKEVLRFSLFQRGASESTLTIHRLVQVVLRDNMPLETQKQWMQRAVNVVETSFPSAVFTDWPVCERLLPHALTCASWIEYASFVTPEAANLLSRAARYLSDHAQYVQAESLFQQALEMRKQQLGLEHADTARAFHNLAHTYLEQGKYKQAEPLFQQTQHILEQTLGFESPEIAHSLHALASISQRRGKYEQAEQLYQRALHIGEHGLGSTHPDIAHSLHGLAHLYEVQGKYELAEQFYYRAFMLRKDALGEEHFITVPSMHGLASIYRRLGKYGQAETLFQQTLHIWEKGLGNPDHPNIARSLHGLAHIYEEQGKYEQAESYFLRTLTMYEKCLGTGHPDLAATLRCFALFYQHQGRLIEAEQVCQRSLKLFEQTSGPRSFDVGRTLVVYVFVLIRSKKVVKVLQMIIQIFKIISAKGDNRRAILKTGTSYAKQAIQRCAKKLLLHIKR